MRVRLFALLLLLVPVRAYAQTGVCPTDGTTVAVNPGWVCVQPGTDYNQNDPVTGQPRVTGLSVSWYLEGVDPTTGQPVQAPFSIGKPALNPQGVIWVQPSQLGAIPVGQRFVAYATATGPGGTSGRSPASNPFGRSNLSPPAAPVTVRVRE